MSRDLGQRPEEPAHDVLAAEAFAVPTADPELRARPVKVPEDPSGIAEPHDILAAEEFAMPAARPAAPAGAGGPGGRGPRSAPALAVASPDARRRVALAGAAGGLLALLRRRRRR